MLDFLQKVYSDDALIIVGRVIQVENTDAHGTVVQAPNHILITKTKSEYLANLSKAFEANEFINVGFTKVTIVQHPDHESIYGITLFQNWTSSNYSDAGYLFLMMDFRNDDAPIIHVRTWQPEIDIDEGEAFQLSDFWIEIIEDPD